MIIDGGTDSSAEMWVCLSCDRRILLRWPPDYEKLVLEPGDDTVIHVGGKGGLRMGNVAVAPPASGEVPEQDRLWLRSQGIDWDGTPA